MLGETLGARKPSLAGRPSFVYHAPSSFAEIRFDNDAVLLHARGAGDGSMTPKADAAALAVDSQNTAEENAMGVQEPRPANVIVLNEENLGRERSYAGAEEREGSARFSQHANDRGEIGAEAPPIDNLAGFIGIQLDGCALKKPLHYRIIKRAFDIVFSACVIVVGFVPCLVLCAFVAKDTGGSPIYKSTRVGRGGRPFHIYKFRSMVADSDDLEKYFTPEQLAQWHREHKVEDDPRITKLGSFLRETSIDEFPQFINVFLGQISVVGPRVITEEEVGYFGSDREKLLSVPPGITGLWQTGPRNLATFESGLRQQMELLYVDNASACFDVKIVFRTVRSMLERTGR